MTKNLVHLKLLPRPILGHTARAVNMEGKVFEYNSQTSPIVFIGMKLKSFIAVLKISFNNLWSGLPQLIMILVIMISYCSQVHKCTTMLDCFDVSEKTHFHGQ